MKSKITYFRKKNTYFETEMSKTELPFKNSAIDMHISSKPADPKRTYSHKPIPSRVLLDKSNIVREPTVDIPSSQLLSSHTQKTKDTGGRTKKQSTNRLIKPFSSEKELPKISISISKLRKKQPLLSDSQSSTTASKKRNLSTMTCLTDLARTKNNPHIDINDLPSNILDELSSFQQLSSDGLPVATSTPKETKIIKQVQPTYTIPDALEKISPVASPLISPTFDPTGLEHDMSKLVLSLNTKEFDKKSTNGPTKELTKQTRNKLKKNGLLVKRLPQPITCDSSLDDEIITNFS